MYVGMSVCECVSCHRRVAQKDILWRYKYKFKRCRAELGGKDKMMRMDAARWCIQMHNDFCFCLDRYPKYLTEPSAMNDSVQACIADK